MTSNQGATPDDLTSWRTNATLSDVPADSPKRTRIGAAWVGITLGLAALVAVLAFALQNLKPTGVAFFSLHGELPLAVLLVLAAALGGATVFAFGAARIVQLRMQARHHRSR